MLKRTDRTINNNIVDGFVYSKHGMKITLAGNIVPTAYKYIDIKIKLSILNNYIDIADECG